MRRNYPVEAGRQLSKIGQFDSDDLRLAGREASPEGDFGRVAKSLIEAGSPWDALNYPTGDARLDDVFMEYLPHRIDGAALLGDADLVLRLLGERPTPDQLALALGGAAKGGLAAMCLSLIGSGADVNSVAGRDRMTPLLHALKGSSLAGSSETVAALLDEGADVGARNRFGSFALHVAASCGASLDTVRLLLRFGAAAHAHVENQFGYTPLRAASETGHEDVAALLRELEARQRPDPGPPDTIQRTAWGA